MKLVTNHKNIPLALSKFHVIYKNDLSSRLKFVEAIYVENVSLDIDKKVNVGKLL